MAGFLRATIQQLWQETPTVMGIKLQVEDYSSITFQPGQWVDFLVPDAQHAGGYSICSTQQQLSADGTLELCVKASMHPCAQWVHKQAQAGCQVLLRVGGSFVVAPGSNTRPCLFIAGGIGITALAAMIAQLVLQPHLYQTSAGQPTSPSFLLYSATSPAEFALLPRLHSWHCKGALLMQLHTTRQHGMPAILQAPPEQAGALAPPAVVHSRIEPQHVDNALKQLLAGRDAGDAIAYVCGPPEMTDDMTRVLKTLSIGQIFTEKWW